MTEPIDDRQAGVEWAAPQPADEPRPVEVRPADGPLPGSPVTLGDSPTSPAVPATAPQPSVPPGPPVRITLPPELRPAWTGPSGAAADWDGAFAPPGALAPPGAFAPPGALAPPDGFALPANPAPPAGPGWGRPGGPPGPNGGPLAPGPYGGPLAPGPYGDPLAPAPQGGHPLADPRWSATRAGAAATAASTTSGPPAPYPGWPSGPGALPRTPSGLFPSGPPRPTYREPHPVRAGAVAAGAGAGALWMLLFGLVATTARGYAWWTISAGITGWLAALVLARYGDRGVAVGVAASTAVGAAIAGSVVFAHFIDGNWLLW
jgi:hypothetical protein